MHAPSASALYRRAANLTPTTTCTVKEPSHCVMCGAPLCPGDAANPLRKKSFGDEFNNKNDLRALSGQYICGDCDVLWSNDWLQKYSKSFACADGVFKFASNDQQAALLLNPPEPPFAIIFSTRQKQHMIWRTPLSLSKDYFVVRVNGELLTIRRKVLMDGLKAFREAEAIMQTVKLEGRKAFLKPPAALFSRELATSKMGMLRFDVEQLMRQTGNVAIIETLHQMSIGEWWALNVIRHYDPENPPAYQNAFAED